jgi:eukaryotic-like serine/threonine-protein kinase
VLERIGRYEVKAELGRGGFGRVYRAWDPTVGRMVAIKTLTAGGDPELLQRFRNEAAAAGKLRHRNIIIIHDFGEQDGEPYIVMELLDGEDLQRVMQNQRPLTLLQRMQIMEQVAEGLDHAHRNGVVHRDVKPANMMVLPDGSVKIMDFGIALVTQVAGSRLTKTGTIPGTLKYMAPEQFRGATNDPLSDIFAFGVTYYELLSGIHPFDGPTQPAIMYNILSGQPRPLSEILPGCPDGLSEVVMRCLHKDREARYTTLDDLQFDLKPILAELKHEHARGLTAEAERLVQAKQYETAQALIRESLELNPADRAARRLRERIQQEMQRQASQPKLEALLNTGRHLLASRKFEDAINTFESALKLDKASQEVASLLQQAQAIRQQSAEAEKLLREAKTALGNQDLTGAYQRINEALQRDPSHPDAVRLVARVKDEIANRERDRRRREEISQARGALLLGAFDEALSLLERIEQAYPESPEIPQLVAEARAAKEAHQRQQRLQAGLTESKALLRDKHLSTAVHRLESLVQEFPAAAEANELLEYARNELRAKKRQETIDRLVREVQALAANQQYDAAIQMLEKGLGYFPGDLTIDRQLEEMRAARAAWQRQTALDEALAQARHWRRDAQHEAALRVLDSFRISFGAEPVADSLRAEIEREWEEKKRNESIQTLLAEIERLLDKNDPATALKVANQAVAKYAAPELEVARARVEKQLQQQKRAEAVSKLVNEVTELTATHRFDRALELIERGLQSYPDDSSLRQAKEAAAAARAGHERREAIAAALAQAQAMLERKQPERAAAICDELLRRYPDASDVAALGAQAREQVRVLDEQRKAVAMAADQARQLSAAGRFDEAIALLEQAGRQFGEQAPLPALLKETKDRKQAAERERGLAAAIESCDEFRIRQEWESARRVLEEASRRFGDDVRLRERRQRVHSEAEAARREQEEARKLEAKRREEEEARKRAEAERKRQEEEQRKLEAKRREEEEARKRAEAERKRQEEEQRKLEAKRKEEEEARKRAEKQRQQEARKKQPEPVAPVSVPEPAAGPNRRWIGVAAAIALVAVGGGIYFATRPDTTETAVVTPTPTPAPTAAPTAAPTPPPPTPTPPPPSVAQGTLAVSAGVAGADVFLDGRRIGATDASGNFRAPVESKRYTVRVEKPGYEPVAPQTIAVPKDGQQTVSFKLVVMEATLALRGATPGALVKIDSRPAGTVGQDGSFNSRLAPGDHTIELSKDQFQARTIRRTFDPGQTVTFDRNEVNLTAIPKVDPQAAVAQEWEKLKGSRDIGQLEDFMRRNRGNPLARNAEERVTELRWEAVDKKNIAALRDYAAKNPNSPYARTAADSVARLEWDALDKNNLKALQEFRQRYPQGEVAARATREMERLEQKAAADRKLAEDKAKADALKGERDAVLQTLSRFTSAIGRKDAAGMAAIYPGSDRQWKDTFANKNFTVTMTLTPVGDPAINGDTASVTCDQQTKTVDRGRDLGGATRRVLVTLAKRGGNWIIQGMK